MRVEGNFELLPNLILPGGFPVPFSLQEIIAPPLQPCTPGVDCDFGQETFMSPSGTTVFKPEQAFESCTRITDPAILAMLIDSMPGDGVTETVEFDHRSSSSAFFIGCRPVTFLADAFAGVDLEVRYRACECETTTQNDDGGQVCAGSSTVIDVTANDSTTCGTIDCSTLTITQTPMHGTAVVEGCNVRYTATDLSFTGVDTFTYSVSSAGSFVCTNSATVSVEVCATNAQDDLGLRVCQGGQISIPVTANDTTSCGTLDCATIQIRQQPAMGTVSVQGCNIVYTAPAGFSGDVSFGYSIANSIGCRDSATVGLRVCAAAANNDSNIRLCQLTSIDIPVLNNDSSTCGTLSCAGVSVVTQPMHGTAVVVQGNPCMIRYTHTDANHSGPDSFVYQIVDSVGCSDTGTVSLDVCLTVAQNDTGRTCSGQSVSIPVRANDGTTCGALNNASITVTTQPPNGTTVVSGANIVYTPNAGFVGQDSFVYSIASNQAPFCSDTATVTIDVCAVDARDDNNIRLCQLSSITIPVTNNDSSSCGTIDCSGASPLMIVTPPLHGTATIQGCSIVYLHTDPNHSGPDSFVYKVTDTIGCMDTATVNLEICLTVAQDDTADVCNGESVTIAARQNDGTTCGVLDCNSIVIVTQPVHGTVVRRGCNLIYTSTDAGFAGQDCFTYSIASNQAPFCSDTAQVCVDVCRTDAADDTGLRVCEGSSLSIPVTANDSSTCGQIDCATLAIVTQPNTGTVQIQGCNILYTAPAGFTGPVSFTYRVSKAGPAACTDTATVSLDVCRTTAQDDLGLQVCRGASVSIPVTANDSSTCGSIDCTTLAIVTSPAHGTVQIQGCNIVYTATDLAFAGVDSFTYRVANATAPACFGEGRVEVTVCAMLASDDLATVCPGESICTPVTANDSTTCGSILCSSLQIVSQPSHGSAQIRGCTICYTANSGFFGQDSLVYRVANGFGCTDTATLRIDVKPEPIARDDKAVLPDTLEPIVIHVLDNDSGGPGCVLVPGSLTITCQGTLGTATPNADGTVTYTPDGDFPEDAADTFCYSVENNCGCRDEATVEVNRQSCPMINRRMPGSLLVFPEFDNRQANQTLYSITNTNCDPQSQTIKVEIVYVNETNCLEFNKTITLTPCDTFTALTSADNPNYQRGYIYAFAKNVQGVPISFNWLIGQEMITDGVDQLEHGINAVVFKAIPPLRQPTDIDNDGIRDLDDVEYQMAPDVLLVPRFLGQDDDFGSKLVLLNLSGGKQFTAVVDFQIFNDNEELFSAQETFRCWYKWRLVDISNAFRNSFLQGTDHNPLEILGQDDRESGWFRIDGNSAFSSQEQIVDPALLGYMIERSGDWTAADLPWELCAQANGDLLPLGLFGDGPNPGPGDNQ